MPLPPILPPVPQPSPTRSSSQAPAGEREQRGGFDAGGRRSDVQAGPAGRSGADPGPSFDKPVETSEKQTAARQGRSDARAGGERESGLATLYSRGLFGQGGRDGGSFDLPELSQGSKGKHVGLLQRSLQALSCGNCRADGQFGARTAEATLAFQGQHGLKNDGVVGRLETWPALREALTSRHDGLTRLGDAMGSTRSISGSLGAELRQLHGVLTEFSGGTPVRAGGEASAPALVSRPSGEMIYVARSHESLADVGRLFGLPATALIIANPDIEKPYLVLPGREIVIPNLIRDEDVRKPPRQLHAADPDGHLAHSNMNPDFVARLNGMIERLRGEGFDIRLTSGFRTFSQQQRRFEQGRSASGPIVTDLEAGCSWHNYGLAVDLALNDEEGRPAWPEASSRFWRRLGEAALDHGVVWGGLFGYPEHVEYHPDFGRDEAASFIDAFESHGLEAVWERIALGVPVM